MAIPAQSKEFPRPDLWEQALDSLSDEERKQYKLESPKNMIEVLKEVCDATEERKKFCDSKGWKIYRNKSGEEVKLQHILKKTSLWVKGIMKVVDTGVSFDQSGHAALPWAIVKFLTTILISDIELFGSLVEGVESSTNLIARYTIVEKLYLRIECEAARGLNESIQKLYAAILIYLARVKKYFSGKSLKRFGRSMLDTLRGEYTELWAKVLETEVEK